MTLSTVSTQITIAAMFLLCALPLRPQSVNLQTTTQERLDTEPWWPTQSNLPLNAFAGSSTCVRCHKDEASTNSMQRAATPAANATFLKGRPTQTFTSKPFTYSLTSTPSGLDYAVSDGPHRLSRKLDWVMGDGILGYTSLYQVDDHWYQSQVTFYTALSALDITTGLAPNVSAAPANRLASALGQPLSPDDTRPLHHLPGLQPAPRRSRPRLRSVPRPWRRPRHPNDLRPTQHPPRPLQYL
jgi:hypothetical protein